MTKRLSHPYQLDESIFMFRASGVFFQFYDIFYENDVSKQNSPRWDGALLFAYVP